MNLSVNEHDVMLHALGGGGRCLGYRNYYCAGASDVAVWDGLAARGLARHEGAVPNIPYPIFCVTAAGLEALRGYGLKVTKKLAACCPTQVAGEPPDGKGGERE